MQFNPLKYLAPDIWSVGIYARESFADKYSNSNNCTVENQIEIMTNFVNSQDDMKLAYEYRDKDKSGGDFDRPSFNSLINDIKAKKVNCVVVKTKSRFGRSVPEYLDYMLNKFPLWGVRFITIDEGLDSLKYPEKTDRIDTIVDIVLDDQSLKKTSIETKAALYAMKLDGKYPYGRPPYGYIKNPENKHQLIIDKEVKDVIVDIFNWYVDGTPMCEIVQKLNTNGIDTPNHHLIKTGQVKSTIKSSSRWSRQTISSILRKVEYTGCFVHNKTVGISYKHKERVDVPRKDWVIIKDVHEPIISQELFDKAQIRYEKKVRKPKRKKVASLFSGYVYCGVCDRRMIAREYSNSKETYTKFFCTANREFGKDGCSNHNIRESEIHKATLDTIKNHFVSFLDFNNKAKSKLTREQRKKIIMLENKKRTLLGKLEENKLVKSNLLDKKISTEDLLKAQELCKNDVDTINSKVTQIDKSILEIQDLKGKTNKIILQMKKLSDLQELNSNVMISLVEKIVVSSSGELNIHLKYADEYNLIERINAV